MSDIHLSLLLKWLHPLQEIESYGKTSKLWPLVGIECSAVASFQGKDHMRNHRKEGQDLGSAVSANKMGLSLLRLSNIRQCRREGRDEMTSPSLSLRVDSTIRQEDKPSSFP